MIRTLGRKWSQKIERYEAKFTIPVDMVEPITSFLSIYCRLDDYSARSEDGYYRVNSLYFDSPRYLFLRKRLDVCENRFNLRIRSYGDQPRLPYFYEIKQKKSGVVLKYRAAVYDKNWADQFASIPSEMEEGTDNDTALLFLNLVHSYHAAPKVLTQYRRRAYVSTVDDYARATVDVALRYQPQEDYSVRPQEEAMIPLDNETLFDPGCDTILELKCTTTRVPLWMIDLIRCFDLRRRAFSKYVASVTETLHLFRYDRAERASVPEDAEEIWDV